MHSFAQARPSGEDKGGKEQAENIGAYHCE